MSKIDVGLLKEYCEDNPRFIDTENLLKFIDTNCEKEQGNVKTVIISKPQKNEGVGGARPEKF